MHNRITIFEKGSPEDGTEDLHFELAGVFHPVEAVNEHGIGQTSKFFHEGHPRNLPPSLVVSIDDGSDDGNHRPFGVFFATKEVNPGNERPALKAKGWIEEYRKNHPVVSFSDSWKTWKEVEDTYINKGIENGN